MSYPVVKGVSYFLAHVPDLVRYGSKPVREIKKSDKLLEQLYSRLRTFEEARNYAPHQAFIGNMRPEALWEVKRPWYANLLPDAPRYGPWGEIMPQDEFYGVVKIVDEFRLFHLTPA
ncbi:MAG TPA: glycine reductase, partial [Firmicutes bacterium]|nr:glycine reductase [Bacillota bacterium]